MDNIFTKIYNNITTDLSSMWDSIIANTYNIETNTISINDINEKLIEIEREINRVIGSPVLNASVIKNNDEFSVEDTKFVSWIKNMGSSKQYYVGGIKIYDFNNNAHRFFVFANYHDFKKASVDIEDLKIKLKILLKKLKNCRKDDDVDIDAAF